jgi:hypothetical protein
VVASGMEHRTLESIRAIGVDEIQYAKGHKYLTLAYQIDAGFTRLLWVGKERTIASFEGFFTVIGKQLAAQIEFVCSDMCTTPRTRCFNEARTLRFLELWPPSLAAKLLGCRHLSSRTAVDPSGLLCRRVPRN